MSESQESNSRIVTEDGIDLRRLFEALLREKLTVIGLTAIAAILSVSYALQIPDTYYSSALLVAKNTQNDTSSLSRIAGQYGGLASLAGVSMGSDGATQSEIAIETLRSLRFFHNYMYEHVLVDLMAAKSWNSDLKSLSIDPTIYDEANSNWVREQIAHFMEDIILSQYNDFELVIVLVNGNRFQLTALEKDINHIETVIFNLLDEKIKLTFQLQEDSKNGKEQKKAKGTEHPLFEKVIETFDGEIIR